MMNKEFLLKVAKAWAEQTIDQWQGEWEAWDFIENLIQEEVNPIDHSVTI